MKALLRRLDYLTASTRGLLLAVTAWDALIVALLGMPFVVAYTAIIYWVFRGRVAVGEGSYH